MRQFLLGVAATLLTLAAIVLVGLLTLGAGPRPTGALPAPAPSGVRVAPPSDLAADETWLGAVDLTSEDVVSGEGDLVDVRATGTGLRFGPQGLHASTLALDATVPFDTVAAQVGDGVRLYAVSGGRAGVERTATVLGRDLTIRATGTVTAAGGQLLIEPDTVDVGGPSFVNSALSAAARALVRIRQPVPGVPEGLVLRKVSVSGAGFAVQLDGEDVTIGRAATPAP